VAVAIVTVYSMFALADPGARSGELSVNGEVSVNGQKFVSGGTIFSGSAIVTAKDSSATANLGKLGRVDLLSSTTMKLNFVDANLVSMLDSGTARVSTPKGVAVSLTTKDGSIVVDGSQATSFLVSTEKGNTVVTTESGMVELHAGTTVTRVGAGDTGTAGAPTPQGGPSIAGIHGSALAALLLATGGAVAAIIWATTHNNDLNFGGTVNVISPTK